MARWKKTAISPFPRHNWIDGGVEEVEEITARLLPDWATRFRGGERSRRWRRSVRNGEVAAARRYAWWRRERGNGAGECVRVDAGLLLELRRVTWRPRQCMHATRRSPPEPVGHGEPDGFLKRFLNFSIQCSMVMTDSTYSTRQHG